MVPIGLENSVSEKYLFHNVIQIPIVISQEHVPCASIPLCKTNLILTEPEKAESEHIESG